MKLLSIFSVVVLAAALACSKTPSTRESQYEPTPAEATFYTCPMHTEVRAPEPGQCPMCGMDLVKIDPAVAGESAMQFDPQRLQKIGVKISPVTRGPLALVVRGEGRVVYDELKQAAVSVWVDGRVEELLVSRVGQAVQRGQPLFRFYSPELIAAQQELLAAPPSARPLLRQRLLRLGMASADIDAVIERGKIIPSIVVVAPVSGAIRQRNVGAGEAIAANTPALTIAPSANVIVEADFFEADAALIRRGDMATLLSPTLGGQSFGGRIAEIYPALDSETRTLRGRIDITDAASPLRPEAFVAVNVAVDLGERLTAPRDAVVIAGDRRVVFVDRGAGRLEPRDVQTGIVAGERVEILSGLMVGESVVASGTFLIASESRLRYATTFWRGVTEFGHEH